MSNSVEKNQSIGYTLFAHGARKDSDGLYYCRAMNGIDGSEYLFCEDCPLCVGFQLGDRGDRFPECRYYDLDKGVSDYLPPEIQKNRIDGLILAGLTGEFPEYLPEDEQGRYFILIERAIRFAAKAHKGTMRKGSHLPYIVHPMETMMLVARMTDDIEVIAAAALHDVVEDTPCTTSDVERLFGKRVAELVGLESENKREAQSRESTWRIRKEENLAREEEAPREAKLIMLADKISNIRATARDFRENGRAIWNKFNMKDPAEQEWYYRSVAKVLSELSDLPLYREYVTLLDEVFS